jgi:predicted DNA-binding antitoxin AbrB/MazE fold protein
MGQQIEAVFENGVFRPLQPVDLPEQHRVTLLLSESEGSVCVAKDSTHAEGADMDQGVGDQALPLQHCQTIRVKFTRAGDFGPIPYPIEDDDALDELEPPLG